ncbi:hypothetical protein Tco_0533729 [Tanacetum coccineum]
MTGGGNYAGSGGSTVMAGSWQVMAGSSRVLAGIAGSARYASTLVSERGTPSSRSSRSGDHQCPRRDSPEYDRCYVCGVNGFAVWLGYLDSEAPESSLLLASNTVSPSSLADVDLEALTGPDGYILGGKGAGMSQRKSSVSVSRFQKQSFLDRKFPLYMMASIDEVVEKSSLADQDDVGSGVIKAESTVIQVEAKRLIQFDLIVMFFNVYSQTTEERSARYASTSFSEMAMYLDSEAPLSSLLSLQLDSFLYGSFSNFRENDAELML